MTDLLLVMCALLYYHRRVPAPSSHARTVAQPTPICEVSCDAPADAPSDLTDGKARTHDLAIIGAGLIGSAAARHAVRGAPCGSRIALVGPSESPRSSWSVREAFGAHHDEGRITRSTDPDPTWALLAHRSIDRYAEIAELGGRDFFEEVGHLAVGPAGSATLTSRLAAAASLGVPHEHLDCEALRRRFPYLCFPEGAEAVWEGSRSGYISARGLVAAQIGAAHRCAAQRRQAEQTAAADDARHSPAADGAKERCTLESTGSSPVARPEQRTCFDEDGEVRSASVGGGGRGGSFTSFERIDGDVVEIAPSSTRGAHEVGLKDGRRIRARRVLVCCGAFTNGPGTNCLLWTAPIGDPPRPPPGPRTHARSSRLVHHRQVGCCLDGSSR